MISLHIDIINCKEINAPQASVHLSIQNKILPAFLSKPYICIWYTFHLSDTLCLFSAQITFQNFTVNVHSGRLHVNCRSTNIQNSLVNFASYSFVIDIYVIFYILVMEVEECHTEFCTLLLKFVEMMKYETESYLMQNIYSIRNPPLWCLSSLRELIVLWNDFL